MGVDPSSESTSPGPVLVVGGTGMLAGVVSGLLRQGLTTAVVSRRPRGPAAVLRREGGAGGGTPQQREAAGAWMSTVMTAREFEERRA
ncbi:hypothetical protein ABZ934_23350 [Streptomyces sp. NPDC046557]|uniref:hypothetical protein n=1 Tax=Streptomyces sp. NPDC046557 TaxID=3155372 RepID=UPI0033E8BA71